IVSHSGDRSEPRVAHFLGRPSRRARRVEKALTHLHRIALAGIQPFARQPLALVAVKVERELRAHDDHFMVASRLLDARFSSPAGVSQRPTRRCRRQARRPTAQGTRLPSGCLYDGKAEPSMPAIRPCILFLVLASVPAFAPANLPSPPTSGS